MAITKIILQQMVTMDQNSITASKYPKYTIVLGSTISSITAGELVSAIESSKASAAAAKQSEINAKQSELNAKDSENEAEISAASSQQSATQSASSATASANSAKAAKTSETNAKASETAAKTSETKAKASETAAKTSETNANSSKTAAAASASAAKTSETNASASAAAAKTSETNANNSKNAAANSANAAKASETNAKTSETNAAASATKAENVASGMKASIGLGDSPRDCPDISGNPSNFLGFLRIYETATGFPSIAVGETVLTGFISGTDGVPSFAGLFVGSSTKAIYSYRWRPESGPLWTKNARIDDVNRLVQLSSETQLLNPGNNAKIIITSGKLWGAYDIENRSYIPLAVGQGGTGGRSISEAKNNLQIPSIGGGEWVTLNAPAGVEDGKYYPVIIDLAYRSLYASGAFIDIKTRSSTGNDPMNCCSFNGFIRCGGWSDRKDGGYGYFNNYARSEIAMKCILSSSKDAERYVAIYIEARGFPVQLRVPAFCEVTVPTSNFTYKNTTYAWGTANPATDSTDVLTMFDFSLNRIGFYQATTEGNYYIGNGERIVLSNGMNVGDELSLYAPKITFSGTIAAGNGVIADGISVSNATFYSRYRVGDTIYGAEFRASENAGQVIVRDPAGINHQFFNFNKEGTFSAPSGILSSTGVDWNTQHNTVNKFYGIAGQVNTPENNVVYGGIHVGFSGNYATQFAGRGSKFWARSIDGGTIGAWNRLITDKFADFGVPVSITKAGEALSIRLTGTDTSQVGYLACRTDSGRLWYVGKGGAAKDVIIHNDMNSSTLTVSDNITLRTPNYNGGIFADGSAVVVRRGNGRTFSYENNQTAAKSATILLWGNTTGRPSVVECKLSDGYLFYAQQSSDGSRVFNVNGKVEATNITQSSDRDLKDNIEEIQNATESLRKMKGYTYTLKENGLPYAGVIAQEVMEALPEAVSGFTKYTDLEGPTLTGEQLVGEERFYSVDYAAITGLLVQAGRESDSRISALESEVSDLKKQIADLTLVVNSLLANKV
ncbi:hypothetical protein VAH1_00150 [Escherichia phage vB_EcoS_VAH1]|uniref:Peptidase S74 domain-containing protein n=1 Tax=Escherichia phage vB_EcoS_VAH1 TaxID=2508173 RepID=A0A482N2Q2_9CAUD|nr:hypothetical protein VAH1_00150 [Escherichia phage vB_EcoS_VAH1]